MLNLKETVSTENAAAKATLEKLRDAGHSGEFLCAWYSRFTRGLLKDAFRNVFSGHERGERVALCGFGSMVRDGLCPYSDVDIVIVCESMSEGLEEKIREFLYGFWDGGVQLAHTIRFPGETLRLASHDLTVATALLDSKPLVGDVSLFRAYHDEYFELVRNPRFRQLSREVLEGWLESESVGLKAFQLEPDLKNGVGGGRSLHRFVWGAKVVWRIAQWDDLGARGICSPFDLETIRFGQQVLFDTRLALRSVVQRKQDILSVDTQDDVAQILGFMRDEAGDTRSVRLLQAVFKAKTALRLVVYRLLECAYDRLTGRQPLRVRYRFGLEEPVLDDRELRLPSIQIDAGGNDSDSILNALKVVRTAQRERRTIRAAVAGWLQGVVQGARSEGYIANQACFDVFWEIVLEGNHAGFGFSLLHEHGLLELLITEFYEVRGLVQRDMYHIYTVDVHLIVCAELVAQFLLGAKFDSGHGDALPREVRVIIQRLQRPHVVILAALLHDIGKAIRGKSHSETGASIACAVSDRMGWSEVDRGDTEFLVREHLTLMVASQRRDLEDPDLVEGLVDVIGTRERLDMLYLLSYADALATGPEAFSDWKHALLRELYLRCHQALLQGGESVVIASRAEEKINRIVGASDSSEQRRIRQYLFDLNARDVIARDDEVLWQEYPLWCEVVDGRSNIACDFIKKNFSYYVSIVGGCDEQLFSWACDIFSGYGINLETAYFSRFLSGVGDVVTIRFVAEPENRIVNEAEVSRLIREVKAGRDTVRGIKEKRQKTLERARSFWPTRGGRIRPRVLFDDEASKEFSVVDIFVEDRIGVLGEIVRILSDSEVNIHLARISREGRKAIAGFYLSQGEERRPLNGEEKLELSHHLLRSLKLPEPFN
ncbi:MAG: HD domain-containing protein [Myxococcota bacterium]|nr:HD domain-containing protein [Myxococcota bacterium]